MATEPDTVEVAGIDAGLTLVNPTTGVCRTGPSNDFCAHTYADRASRVELLGQRPLAALAIDAPILGNGLLNYRERPCEKVFVWKPFQGRCKPGESHFSRTGTGLRRAGADTVLSLKGLMAADVPQKSLPQVIEGVNMFEAFPNAFLGVSLEESTFAGEVKRREKFDWLYDQWLKRGVATGLQAILGWSQPKFWEGVRKNRQHDERAAITCPLTAICAVRGRYVAVGEAEGGYFFLPPWDLWQPWAKEGLRANRGDRRLNQLGAEVEVWIDGKRYRKDETLPGVEHPLGDRSVGRWGVRPPVS
jgi:hypothetical protein